MPWNGLVGQHMQGRVCLQSWPLLGPFGRLLADFLRYSYYNRTIANRTITVLSYENRTFPYYNRTTTLRTNPVRPHATGPYQPRTTKARFLRNCPLWDKPGGGTTPGLDPGMPDPGCTWVRRKKSHLGKTRQKYLRPVGGQRFSPPPRGRSRRSWTDPGSSRVYGPGLFLGMVALMKSV